MKDNGNCEVLPWLESVVLTDKMLGPGTPVVANHSGLGYVEAVGNNKYTEYEKLLVKIPIKGSF